MKKFGFFLLAVSLVCSAEEETEKQSLNLEAIPPVISPDDPELSLSPEEQLRLLNAKKADYIVKDVKLGNKKMPSIYESRLQDIQRKKFDQNPRQTISVQECIKPDGVIDNEVNECMNGRIKKNW